MSVTACIKQEDLNRVAIFGNDGGRSTKPWIVMLMIEAGGQRWTTSRERFARRHEARAAFNRLMRNTSGGD